MTAAHAENSYPVWFAPHLGIESVEDIDRKLDERLWEDGETIILTKRGSDAGGDRLLRLEAATCREFLDAVALRYNPVVEYFSEKRRYFSVYGDCQDIERLKDARPAAVSYVRDFALDENAPAILPITFEMPWSPYGMRAVCPMHRRGDAWASLQQIRYLVEKTRYDEEKGDVVPIVGYHRDHLYSTEHSLLRITLHAKADFDGDGVEDLMIRNIRYGHTNQPVILQCTFILTRQGPDDVLRDLDAGDCACGPMRPPF